ncbi:fimbrial biogenesis chaperone [Kineobactrum salinum]|uniref:Molecular chaperone n=1 Tax=Kineobactrum salinum TaxID=2708301 RepID=A0A6C0U508_9GAMM|nr:molecular chaperone [Kineobactrum salinum]QIB67076.1 molecular chaperone [Kineobactrum salinum]
MIDEVRVSTATVSAYCTAFLAFMLVFSAASGRAELMLYPTRVVIEGNQRTAQVQLINTGTESRTYRISLVNRRMSDTGEFSDVVEPLAGERFAKDLLRFSPRQVTLVPGEGQTVRIMARKPANLVPGEYRSHLLFSQQPAAETLGRDIETRQHPGKGIGVMITALIGASIPLIVRHGTLEAELELTQLQLQASGEAQFLALSMERSGERSVYGDLAVSFTPRGGAETLVARANGLAVYFPNRVRRARIALEFPQGRPLTEGTLHVRFQEPAEAGGKLLAEAALQVR